MRNVAVVGSGYWGRNLVRNFAALNVLRIVCDTDQTVLDGISEKYPGIETTTDFQSVLREEGVKAVVIATPAVTHFDLTRAALRSGKDVMVEKPLALTVQEAEELDHLARVGSRILMVGHILEYHPAIRTMQQYIREGRLGKLYYLYSNRINFGKIRHDENILWSFAPHDISVFLLLAGEMPVRVTSNGGAFLNHTIADVTVSTFEFRSGVRGHIFVNWLNPFKEQRLAAIGSEGMMVFTDTAPSNEKLLFYPHRVGWIAGTVPTAERQDAESITFDDIEPLSEECTHFFRCVLQRTTPLTDGVNAIRVLTVLSACQRSLDLRGSPVVVGDRPDAWVHPTAFVHPQAQVGRGTKVWNHAQVLEGAVVGERCMIGHNCTVFGKATLGNGVKLESNVDVWPRVILEDEVFIGPSAVLTNDLTPRAAEPKGGNFVPTLIKQGASIGANATIVCGITIGRYAAVGAGATVTKDVPDHALVVGSPARRMAWICACNQWGRLAFTDGVATCPSCERRYQLTEGMVREITKTKQTVL